MKKTITVTIDAEIAKRAHNIAKSRRSTISAVIEDCVRAAPDNSEQPRRTRSSADSTSSFVDKWRGKLRLRSTSRPDPLLETLKAKYGLNDK